MKLSDLSGILDLPEWEQHVFLWRPNSEEPMLALGKQDFRAAPQEGSWSMNELNASGKWWFGFLTYDLKDRLEDALHAKENAFNLPLWKFFSPKLLLKWSNGKWEEVVNVIHFPWMDYLERPNENSVERNPIAWRPMLSREEYIRRVEILKEHIRKGDIYEVNFTYAFESRAKQLDSYRYFLELNDGTRAPYAAYMRMGSFSLCCASPEQFLFKKGRRVFSSPIKGTVRRGHTQEEDEQLKAKLREDEKERSENVMIVDLVRNDFSKIARPSSVQVDELFGVYTFKTVHHMISTVSAELKESVTLDDLIFSTFPMGSMTGAPKPSAMQLAEKWEEGSRGLYSGSVGVISPEGDLELNVVIRSVVRDESTGYMRCNVGGAITHLCNAEREYEESLLKARAVLSLA